MALRLDSAVIRGEIDNTTPGNVRSRLWLVGRDEPVVLDLRGDAWRDIAGCKLTFTNPDPEPQPAAAALKAKQNGYVGDITASRKVKVFTGPEEEWLDADEDEDSEPPPAEWRNCLYLEWFSEANGRVVIESAGFELSITEWLWEMDEAAEEAQKMTNLHAMRGWLAGIIQRPEPADEDEEFDDSEESWEDSLKQSDRLTDAHIEALEKYGEEDLGDDRIAFVMGWDHMLGDRSEDKTGADDETGPDEIWKQTDEPDAAGGDQDDAEDFLEWLEERERKNHPLKKRAHELVLRLLTEIDEEREGNAQTSDGSTPLDHFIRNTMNISGKLAGALGGTDSTGYILAILRRCLNWANEALASLNELMEAPEWQARLELLKEYRTELFAIRDDITDLRKALREK